MKVLCCSSSAMAKNSSISCDVGMRLCSISLALLLAPAEGRVLDPGVPTTSGSLNKLQGVDSLIPLPKERNFNPHYNINHPKLSKKIYMTNNSDQGSSYYKGCSSSYHYPLAPCRETNTGGHCTSIHGTNNHYGNDSQSAKTFQAISKAKQPRSDF